jgi:hypothetical protein
MTHYAEINEDGSNIWEAGYTNLAIELIDALPPRVARRIAALMTDEYWLLNFRRYCRINSAVRYWAKDFCDRKDVQVLGLETIVAYLDLAFAAQKADA